MLKVRLSFEAYITNEGEPMTFALGPAIRRTRKETTDLTLEDVAEKVGLTATTISRYERGQREPSDNVLEDIAQALNTTPEQLEDLADEMAEEDQARKGEEVVHFTAPKDYVTSKEDVSNWRNRVIHDTNLEDEEQLILMSLPAFLDEVSWIVPITEDMFIEKTGRKRSMVENYWQGALNSDYVEQVSERPKWVLRLTFPD